MNIFVDKSFFWKMDDTELQFKQIKEYGVLKWNIAENITNIQKQVMNTSIGLFQKLKF